MPYGSGSEVLVSRARVIDPDGKVVELDQSKILEAEDEETGRSYKYFAFEGIVKGSIVEFYHIIRTSPSIRGTQLVFQSDYPKYNNTFELHSPVNLEFAFKSYNAMPQVVEVPTGDTDPYFWEAGNFDLPALENEETAANLASRPSVIYKLDKNHAHNTVGISDYSQIVKNIYGYYNAEVSSKADKLLEKLQKDALDGQNLEGEDLIRQLDHHIKTSFYITEANQPGLEDLEVILKQNVANQTGIVRLYAALFNKMEGLDYYPALFEFVFGDDTITQNRMERALAHFQRAMISSDSQWDRAYAQVFGPGAPNRALNEALPGFTASEQRGRQLFTEFV